MQPVKARCGDIYLVERCRCVGGKRFCMRGNRYNNRGARRSERNICRLYSRPAELFLKKY
jgi:hypothetical protein